MQTEYCVTMGIMTAIAIILIVRAVTRKNEKEEWIPVSVEFNKAKPKLEFRPGDKVISVSNEDEPYMVGIFVEYQEVSLAKNLIPVVEFDDGIKLCFSHLVPYSGALCIKLDKLNNTEQWNSLVHTHAQLKTHRGMKCQTFECQCESCRELMMVGTFPENESFPH